MLFCRVGYFNYSGTIVIIRLGPKNGEPVCSEEMREAI